VQRTIPSILIFYLVLLAGCVEDGPDPPMIHGGFPHAGVVGESGGGEACLDCHASTVYNAMSASSGYHHVMAGDDPTAAVISGALGGAADAQRNCLMCHVDHDVFNPGVNAASLGRSHNLRISAGVAPTASPGTFTNTDFVDAHPDGGICLSCHTTAQTPAHSPPDGASAILTVDRGRFAAATDAHNYTVGSTFGSDGSAFQANCLKCHDDGRTAGFQTSPPSFSLHDGLYAHFNPPLGASFSPADPPTASEPNLLEEDSCFRCHGPASSYAGSPGAGVFQTATLSARAMNLRALFEDGTRPHRHPVLVYRGRHRPSNGNISAGAPDDLEGANRHAECADCHDPHAARPGVHAPPGNGVSPVLAGAWGVEPTYGAGTTPTGFVVQSPATAEYQVCLKCHASYAVGAPTDRAQALSPNRTSYHPVLAAGANAAMPDALLSPWTSASTMHCTDCHGADGTSGTDVPRGPHASAHAHILKKPYGAAGSAQDAGDVCFDCHDLYTYTGQGMDQGYSSNFTRNNNSLHTSRLQHRLYGCRVCHAVHGADNEHLIALYDAATNPDGELTSYTERTPGNYMKSSCGTRTAGCH